MAKKLVRVAKTREHLTFLPGVRIRNELTAINPRESRHEGEGELFETCEFFLAEEQDVENVVRVLAEKYPGCAVQVYELTQESICPAAPMVTKQVTKDGILPA